MSALMIIISALGITSETISGDYWHALTWAIVGLGIIVQILDDRIIANLKSENASIRASRDSWKDAARSSQAYGRRDA